MARRRAAVTGAISLSFAAICCSPTPKQTDEQAVSAPSLPSETADAMAALPVDFAILPAGYSDEGWISDSHLELLCNPDKQRFILQTSPPQHRSVAGYPKRHLWDVDDLYVAVSEGFRRDQGFADSRRSFARCGDYVIVVEADKANFNWEGHDGAYGPYFAVRIVNDFRMVYPNEARYDGRGTVPMGGLSAMWGEAPGDRDGRGCPFRMVSAIDVRLDLEAEATKVNLIVRDPGEFKGNNELDERRDYSDCSRAVYGNQTTIVFTGPDYDRPGLNDAPWIF